MDEEGIFLALSMSACCQAYCLRSGTMYVNLFMGVSLTEIRRSAKEAFAHPSIHTPVGHEVIIPAANADTVASRIIADHFHHGSGKAVEVHEERKGEVVIFSLGQLSRPPVEHTPTVSTLMEMTMPATAKGTRQQLTQVGLEAAIA